jgi:phospholipid-translocating ATPase
MGFCFEKVDEDGYMICHVPELGEERQKYKLLNIIEFDSDRKRMTVIVETPDNRILVVCKGADSILEPRLR